MKLTHLWFRPAARGALGVMAGGMLLAQAAIADTAPPATISADEIHLDAAGGRRVYRGNVIFQRAEMRLTCDELITRYNRREELTHGECAGQPARFKQRRGQDTVRAHAFSISFDRRLGQIILRRQAQLEHRGARLTGAQITYDLATEQTVVKRAPGGGAAESRPRLLLPAPSAE